MNCSQSGFDGPDSGFFSATFMSERKDRSDNESSNESENLRSQLNRLKNSLKMRVQDLREQQELTRDLEEELERTKLDLANLQDKCERQDRRNKSVIISSLSDPGLSWRYGTLFSAVNKVEETLQNLSKKHSCGLSECRNVIQQEMEKIRSVKNDLKVLECNSKKQFNFESKQTACADIFENVEGTHSEPDVTQASKCNLIHIDEVEIFREKAVTGVAALEKMKQQIDILENIVKKYIEEFPCDCDKSRLQICEEKLDKLREEFDEITDHLCCMLQKINGTNLERSYNNSCQSCYDLAKCKENQSVNTDESFLLEDYCRLTTDCQSLQKEIFDQQNEIEKLRNVSLQLEAELDQKRKQLCQDGREIDLRMCEIMRIKELMNEICENLQETPCGASGNATFSELESSRQSTSANLKNFFSSLQKFATVLEKSKGVLCDIPRLKEDNEKLKEKLYSMEKYICNKEETLKELQDTVKLRECQIGELNSKMQTSVNEASKLTQDVDEKCRLISNLQEAVRKCKQFEVKAKLIQVNSVTAKLNELEWKLKKSEKEVLSREQKMDLLYDKILDLSSQNFLLTQDISVMEPRLKSMYKTCHLFEKMVCDLQKELNVREVEMENLCGKIKELEDDLEAESKRCESRACEDSKYIESLKLEVKNYQEKLCCITETCNSSIADVENRLLEEQEKNAERECELKNKICHLKQEVGMLQRRLEEYAQDETSGAKISSLESIIRQAEARQEVYDRKVTELQNILGCTITEHEEERKNILEKLSEEKRENLKNKNLITELNENIKRKITNEKILEERIQWFTEDNNVLTEENMQLKAELEVRKKIICALEKNENSNLSDLEEIICHLKVQKADVKSRCCSLRAELDRELKLKRVLENRIEELTLMWENKMQEFEEMVNNYKCTSSKLQQTLEKVKRAEEDLIRTENTLKNNLESCEELSEFECLKKILYIKTVENAKLFSSLLVTKVELEGLHTEYFATQASKDCLISHLKYEINCFEKKFEDIQENYMKLEKENKRIQDELDYCAGENSNMKCEFKEKQKELCAKLRSTICEKNELLSSVDKLQRQLERICLENVNKEEMNKELVKECSRLKINNEVNDSYIRSKSDKIICNLTKEVKNLQCELCGLKETYGILNEKYQELLTQLKSSEKKKSNLEKLYIQMNNENKDLQELKMKMEKELCELKTQNVLLKEKISVSTKSGETDGNGDDKQALRSKVRELTMQIKALEKRVIPDLEQEIAEKNCCIENLKVELRDANISSQRMRNEALRVIQHTKKYLAAQRCANESLKSRLECSNKRGNLLGAENRELEEQLKAVTRMNEFLLCQLESSKNDVIEEEPRNFSPLPWSCATVERDTSSSEYIAESGIQSMQQSPTDMDFNVHDVRQDPKRSSPQWSNLKRSKYGGSAEHPSCHSSISALDAETQLRLPDGAI